MQRLKRHQEWGQAEEMSGENRNDFEEESESDEIRSIVICRDMKMRHLEFMYV